MSSSGRRSARAALVAGAAAVLVATAITACSGSPAAWPAWSPAAGPEAGGAVDVGALLPTGGGWLTVGAVANGDDRAPAEWRSAPDGWTPVPVAPISYYGERSLLHLAAVGPDGTTVAVGWAAGGAHGNPRTATWTLLGGTLREQPAEFELFGGERAIDVVGVANLGSTWLILGNRSDAAGRPGGGLWRSTDGVTFAAVDEAALASGPNETVRVNGVATLAGGQGVVAVGERATPGRAARPAAWSTTDGRHWRRDDVADLVPDDATVARSLTMVVATPGGATAVGLDDEGPTQRYRAAVRDPSGRWRLGGSFAPTTNDELPRVGALGAVGSRVAVLVRVEGVYQLWWAEDGAGRWRRATTPEAISAGNDTSVVLAGSPDELRLVVNRPGGAAWWSSPAP